MQTRFEYFHRPLDFIIKREESELVVLKNHAGVLPRKVQASLRYGVFIDATKVKKVDKLEAEIKVCFFLSRRNKM